MTFIGDLGADRADVDELVFGYFGSRIRVNPNLTDLVIVDLFTEMADAGQSEDATKTAAALRSMRSALIHPDDLDEFNTRVREHRQSLADLVELTKKLLEAVTARPTSRLSDSSDGPSATTASSGDDSSSAALRLLQGRPDLAVAVVQAKESRSA
jgi:hypothetical protein